MNVETLAGFVQRLLNHLLEPWSTREHFTFAVTAGLRTFTDFTSEFGWPHLLSMLGLMAILFFLQRKTLATDGISFSKFIFPRHIYRHPSAILDYKFAGVNTSIDLLMFAPIITGISQLVYEVTLHLLAGPWFMKAFNSHPIAITVAIVSELMIVSDFLYFVSHYLMHRIPILWTFHKVHHSSEVLTPISVARVHPVDRLVQAVVRSFCSGVGAGLYTTVNDVHLTIGTLFGTNIVLFLFLSFAYNLRHSHIWLSYGPVISRLLISPAQHQIHHSRNSKHNDKNFGLMFAFWDGMFGTLYIPRTRENLTYGITDGASDKFLTVRQLYFAPFADLTQTVLHASHRYLERTHDAIKASGILARKIPFIGVHKGS